MMKGLVLGSIAIAAVLLVVGAPATASGKDHHVNAERAAHLATGSVFAAPVLTSIPDSAWEPVANPLFSSTDGAGINGVDNIGTASFLHVEQTAVCGSSCELVVGDDQVWGLTVAAGQPNFPFHWSSGASSPGVAGGTYAQSTVWMDTNGYIAFADPVSSVTTGTIPSTATPNNIVAGDWQDLDTNACPLGQDPYVGVSGTTPNRVYYIEFWNDPHYSTDIFGFENCGSASQNFEFQIYESDNHVDVVYLNNVDGFTAKGGEENSAGTTGLSYFSSTAVPDNVGIRYRDITAPSVTAITRTCGVLGNSNWCRSTTGNTVTITDNNDISTVMGTGVRFRNWTASGATSGSGSYTSGGAFQPITTYNQGTTTIAGQPKDWAGNVPSASVNVLVDSISPTVSISATSCTLNGNNGWCRGTLSVPWTASDATSGISSVACTLDGVSAACGGTTSGTISIATDGTHSVQVCATDVAGNPQTCTTASSLKRDATSPTLTGSRSPPANGFGWNNGAVSVSWTCSDATSGSAGDPANTVTSTEGASQTATSSCLDNAGNTGSGSVTGINIDLTAPVLSGSRSPAANANGWNNANVVASWTCSDALSGVNTAPSPVTISTEGTAQTATGTCTDKAGNSGSNTVTGINIDKTKPVLGSHADITAEATSASGAVVSYANPGATDDRSGAGSVACAPVSGSQFAFGDTTVTCNVNDLAGNAATARTFLVHVVDSSGPTIDAHADVTAEATGSSGAAVSYAPPATHDAVDGNGSASCAPASGSMFALGDTQLTCTATDSHGNSATPTHFTIHVVDTTPPTIDAHGDITAEATGASGAVVSYSAPATHDAVDGTRSASCSPPSGSTFGLGSTQVQCFATDAHGNAADPTSFFVNVVDTTPPAIAPHASVTAEATGPTGAIVTYDDATTSDAVDGAGVATCSPQSGAAFALGDTTVTCHATDAHGNQATPTSFLVHVVDTTPPTIAAHDDIVVEATAPAGAVVSYDAPATHDLVDGDGIAVCSPGSGSTLPLGTATITCSAADAHGNAASDTTFTATVRDTTPPLIDGHADVIAEATSAAGAVVTYASPATHDAVDGAGIATCAPTSGSPFALGSTTVSCSASDAHGNAATPITFRVRVGDTTPPTIDAHADITAEATGASGAAVTYSAPATHDAVDGAGIASCVPASGSVFALGATSVSCFATDAAGNDATPTSFAIRVVDTTPPTIASHGDVVTEATAPAGAVVRYDSPATSDIVDGDGVATCAPASGSTFALGATTVTCTASDAHGNAASATTFTARVTDTTPPIVSVPADIRVEATGSDGAVATFSASASDIVDGALAPTCAPASGSTFPLGATLVTCRATDAHGNAASASFQITVVDTTAPVIDAHSDLTHEATAPTGAPVTFDAPATHDAVDGDGVAECSPASGATFAVGDTTVTCRATDSDGNAATPTSFLVHVVDTTAPVIAAHDDITAEATSAAGASVPYASPRTSDAVDGMGVASCAPASGSLFALGASAVTCTASDAHGNAATPTSFLVHVVDTTAPLIAAHDDITVEADGSDGSVVSYDPPATSDAVDGAGIATCAPASGSQFALGDTTITCDATDAAGNLATSTRFAIHVRDTIAPVIRSTTSGARGSHGWYVSDADVRLSCADNAAGVAKLTFSLDGAHAAPYVGAIPVASEGANDVLATCIDNSGNTATLDIIVNVDTRVPTGSASTPVASAGPYEVAWSASDPTPGSGIALVEVQERPLFGALGDTWTTVCSQPLAGGPANATGTCERDPPPEQYCYRVVVTDVAGNVFVGLASDLPDVAGALNDLTTSCTLKGTPGQTASAVVEAASARSPSPTVRRSAR